MLSFLNVNMVIFLQEYWVCWLFKVKNLRIRSSIRKNIQWLLYFLPISMNFPLQQSGSETTKNTVDKVQKRKKEKKEREGKGQITNARQSYQAREGGIFFLCFFLRSHPVFNVMLIYSKLHVKWTIVVFSSLNPFTYAFKINFLIEQLLCWKMSIVWNPFRLISRIMVIKKS